MKVILEQPSSIALTARWLFWVTYEKQGKVSGLEKSCHLKGDIELGIPGR